MERVSFLLFCWVQCDSGYGKDLSLGDYGCAYCQAVLTSCFECTNTSYCTLYCHDSMLNCNTCSTSITCTSCYIGNIISGGCSDVDGCVRVEQFDQAAANHSALCVECDAGEFSLVGGVCECLFTGESIITGHCTTVVGCITTIRSNGVTRCACCNHTLGFALSADNSCPCADGYELQLDRCGEVCGDGRLFSLACDDGNTESGDGCSSECIV